MHKLIAIVILFVCACVSTVGPVETANEGEAVAFHGRVSDIYTDAGIKDARVEVRCGPCGWEGETYTGADGWYEIYGGDHGGHHICAAVEAPGYIPMGSFSQAGPAPCRLDFKLYPE